MKAGLYNTECVIMRKTVIPGEYRDKEVWQDVYRTKCNFSFAQGSRVLENHEIFFDSTAVITVRSYVPVEDEDHVRVRGVEYRIVTINRQPETTRNSIEIRIEKVNK